ncbi:MAG: hypothetical protein U5J98_09695 [Halobacteriales archaeon]|nr:hypothetical protein [Halobacteriales archaeon]
MSTVDSGRRLEGVPRWVAGLFVHFIGGIFIWGLLVTVASSPAWGLVPSVYPASEPFLYLSISGVVLSMLGARLNEAETEQFQEFVDHLVELDTVGKWIYVSSLMVLLVFGLSLLVGLTGVVSTYIANDLGLGAAAVALALLYPVLDAYIGRWTGWNVASMGALVGLAVMAIVSAINRRPTSVPRQAATDLRESWVGL